MERYPDKAPVRDRDFYSRRSKKRRAALSIIRDEFPVEGCPLPRSELAVLSLRDTGLQWKEIANQRDRSLNTIKVQAARIRLRVGELLETKIHETNDALSYVKEQGWLEAFRRSQNG